MTMTNIDDIYDKQNKRDDAISEDSDSDQTYQSYPLCIVF